MDLADKFSAFGNTEFIMVVLAVFLKQKELLCYMLCNCIKKECF